MNLNDFRSGNFVSFGEDIAKVVIPETETIRIKLRDGSEIETDKIARVFLSLEQFKKIEGLKRLGDECFALPCVPGYFKYNKTLYQFEWVVEGFTIRTLDDLDEIQNIFYYVANKQLFP